MPRPKNADLHPKPDLVQKIELLSAAGTTTRAIISLVGIGSLETLHTPGQTTVRPGTIALQSLIHLDTVLIGVRHSYWDVVGRHSWNTNPF